MMADRDYQIREDREDADDAATVWRQSGVAVYGRLVNISSNGCRVRHRKTLWLGERVVVEIHGRGPMPAIVRWSLLGNAGLKFCDWHEARSRGAAVNGSPTRVAGWTLDQRRRMGKGPITLTRCT